MPHRLYLSTAELALLTLDPPPLPPSPLRCPYQVDSACRARARRPLGCRLFFCKPPPPDDAYERLHNTIRRMHGEYAIDYHYVELTAALARLERA